MNNKDEVVQSGDENKASIRFFADIDKLVSNLEARFSKHLEDGQPVAALEARLLARLIETRQFDGAIKWGNEYQGSIEQGL